jgi:hypothetical protein
MSSKSGRSASERKKQKAKKGNQFLLFTKSAVVGPLTQTFTSSSHHPQRIFVSGELDLMFDDDEGIVVKRCSV